MRIFIIPQTFPNSINQNAGIFIHTQCCALQSKGHEIIVLDTSPMNYLNWLKVPNFFLQEKRTDGFLVLSKHVHGFASSRFPRIATFQYDIAMRRMFKKATKKYGKPEVIYAHFSFLSGYSAVKIGKKYKIPTVILEHYSLYLKEKIHPYIKNITKKTIEMSSEFIAVSKHLADNLSKSCNPIRPISIVPNMVKDVFSYTLPPDREPFVFITIGKLLELKGMDVLVDEFIRPFKSNDHVILKIIGTGPLLSTLMDQVELEKRTEQIQFLGNQPPSHVSEELKNSHCFVLLSKVETFGIAYREAMITGRPILSWENAGVRLNWKNSYGLIVDSIDTVGLALVNIMQNYDQYNTKQISDDAFNLYSENVVMDSITKVLSHAVEAYKTNN